MHKKLEEKIKSFMPSEEPVSPKKLQQKVTLSELIKNRGRVIDMKRKNASFNDLVDERYDQERKEIRKNLIELDPVMKTGQKLFEYSFKRSLQNHIDELKQREEQEIENQLRKQ
jgi:hypothetical protein